MPDGVTNHITSYDVISNGVIAKNIDVSYLSREGSSHGPTARGKKLICVISVVLLPYASEICVKFSKFSDFIV